MDGMDGKRSQFRICSIEYRTLKPTTEGGGRATDCCSRMEATQRNGREDSESVHRCWLRGLTGGRTSKRSTTTSLCGIWTGSDEWKERETRSQVCAVARGQCLCARRAQVIKRALLDARTVRTSCKCIEEVGDLLIGRT
ncbi:hypothetical protein PI125_g7652 [Phytophthora idaei]|nr:hypothetical protein PI125_g7652 [Phytophthora idaei]